MAVFKDGKPQLIPNALGQVLTPSVVAVLNGQMVVGQTARAVALSNPGQAAALFKRAMGTERAYPFGGTDYSAPELSAMVLKSLKADAEAHLGVTVHDVVISVPAYFNELQRRAVRTAGRIAGLNVTRLINEPTAAALAYGLHEQGGETRILVIDLGGGTFDVSLLDLFDGVMEVRATAGDAFLGGEDFTDLLARHIAQHHAIDPNDPALRPGLLTLAEAAKRSLSTEATVAIKSNVAGHQIDMTLTRDRFDEVTAQLIARLAAPLDRTLGDAGVTPATIDKIVLVGGATRMAAIRGFVSRKLRAFPTMGLDPDHVVALGAAVQAALVAGDRALDDMVMTDVAAFTLGVDTVHRVGNGWREGYFAPIIERNSVVPTSRESIFQTVQLGQEKIRFGIYQGESPLVMHNLALGQIEVPVPRNLTGHESARVRFTYDVSGLLEVEVTVVSTGRRANLVVQQLTGEMSETDIQTALHKMAALKTHPRDEAANIHLRARIEAAYAMSRDTGRAWVTDLLLQLDTAIEAQDKAALIPLRAEIHAALDAFEATHVT